MLYETLIPKTFPVQGSVMVLEATSKGYLSILQWLRKRHPLNSSFVYAIAARHNRMNILQWLFFQLRVGNVHDAHITGQAAAGGHLSVLKWLDRKGFTISLVAAGHAAHNGHLDVLQWLCNFPKAWCPFFIASEAASGGQYRLFRWLYHRYGHQFDLGNAMEAAAFQNQVEFLQLVHEELCPLTNFGTRILCPAIKADNINVVEWVAHKAMPFDVRIIVNFAVGFGAKSVLRWCLAQRMTFPDTSTVTAVRNGRMEILIWLVTEARCKLLSECLEQALLLNDVAMATWLMSMQCPIPPIALLQVTAATACKMGSLTTLEWMLHELDFPFLHEECLQFAESRSMGHVIAWIENWLKRGKKRRRTAD